MTLKRLGLLGVCVFSIALQAATYWFWSKGAIPKFSEIYSVFGHAMPLWTKFVFATWRQWWLAPAVSTFLLLGALIFKRNSMSALAVSILVAMIVLLAMWYAMYPLHAMVHL
jgi:hypothetical protein